MLRLSHQEQQHAQDFQQLHLDARREAFGRLFRSPTVWEDLLKSILLCNCGLVGLAAGCRLQAAITCLQELDRNLTVNCVTTQQRNKYVNVISTPLGAARTSVQHAHKCLACMHVQSWLHLHYSC